MDQAAIVSIAVAVIASLSSGWAVFTVRAQSRQLNAEARSLDVGTMRQAVETAREEADRATAARDQAQDALEKLENEVERLAQEHQACQDLMERWIDFVRVNFGFDLRKVQ